MITFLFCCVGEKDPMFRLEASISKKKNWFSFKCVDSNKKVNRNYGNSLKSLDIFWGKSAALGKIKFGFNVSNSLAYP